jgi:hypothetical protein
MTVVFHDEDLYRNLKVEAARREVAASAIISEAVRKWLETTGGATISRSKDGGGDGDGAGRSLQMKDRKGLL